MLLTKEVEVSVSRKCAKKYREKGYYLSFEGEKKSCKTLVKIEDLSNGSHVYVDVKCDYCNEKTSVKYKDYNKQINVCEINKFACSSCYGKKKKEVHEYKLKNDSEYKKRFDEKVIKSQEFAKTRLHSLSFIQEEFKKRGYELLDTEYKGNKHIMNYICPSHGIKQINYHNLSQGKGCQECSNEKARKCFEDFEKELKNKFNEKIIPLEKYVTNDTYIKFYCKDCDKEFSSKPRTVLSNKHGCPYCSQHKNEKILYDYICEFYDGVKRGIEFDGLIGVGGGNLSYDIGFELDGKKYLIERQGEQHEIPVCFNGMTKEESVVQFEKQKEHDRRKREYAEKNGYILIEVWYHEDYKEKLKQYGLCVS